MFNLSDDFDIVYPMRKCSLCGKGTAIGRNRSHAQNRTSRTFKANVQKVTLTVGEEKISGIYCSKCLKKMKGEIKKTAL
jgi:large subunit ribosomal protein L28